MTGNAQRLAVAVAFAMISQATAADDADDAQRVCGMFDSMGAAVECKVDAEETAVDVTTGEGVDDAGQFCTTMAAMVAPLVQSLSSGWTMRIFTPGSGDAPAAVCDLK